MEKEISDLKSVLRSLVVSSPTQVDVRTLMRDYKNMVGKPIPLSKYGYRDPVSFLKERFKDCFLFQGPELNPILYLIVPDTLKHIDQFVQKQKIPSTCKFKGKRRSITEPVSRPHQNRNLIVNTFAPKPPERSFKPIQENNNSNYKSNSNITNHKSNYSISNHQPITNDKDSSYSEPIEASCNSLNKMSLTNTPHIIDGKSSSSAVQNFLKKRIQMSPSEYLNRNDDNNSCSTKDSSKDADSGRLTASSGCSSKQAKLDELKAEILALLEDNPEGIWCTDLIRLYRERYHRELNFARFGYTSIVSLVCVLEESLTVWHSDAAGDWLLSEKREGVPLLPRRTPLPPRQLPRRPGGEKVDVDDALPGIDFDPDVFPTDCMHFLESIPVPDLSDLEAGAMIEVMIGEIYSPSHFWFIRLGENYNIAMENIMDEMNTYYNSPEGQRFLSRGAVRVGHYCASLYDNDWHRSLIVSIIDSDTVKVRHVDYGTVERVSVASLRPLRRVCAALPSQAIRGRLAGARPGAAGRRWQHAAAAAFLALVSNKRLYANVTAALPTEDTIELFLIDTSGDEDLCVTAELIRMSHADGRPDSCLGTSESYLYPRFEVLESGATPNYAEIYMYLRDGINLEYVDEFRMHVPSCLPPRHDPPPLPSPLPSPVPDSPDTTTSESSDPPAPPTPEVLSNPLNKSLQPDLIPRQASSPPPLDQTKRTVEKSVQVEEERCDVRKSPPRVPPPAPQHMFPPIRQRFPPPPMLSPQFRPAFPPQQSFQPYFPPTPPFQNFQMPNSYPQHPPLYASQYPLPAHYPGNPMHFSQQNIPGLRFPGPPQHSPVMHERSPPPPYHDTTHNSPSAARDGITLTASECEIFCLLSKVNAQAAKSYMVDAISRAMKKTTTSHSTSVTSTLNPEASEFRCVTTETQTEDILISLDDSDSHSSPELTPAVRLFLQNASNNCHEVVRPPPGFENYQQ